MDGWALILTAMGGVLTLFTFFAATWKLFRFVFRVDRALPIILEIAHQFQDNGGSTLKSKIDKINEKTEYLSTEHRVVTKIAEDSRLIAQTNAAIVNELTSTQTDDIHHIKEYLHDKLHEIGNSLSKTTLQAGLAEKRAARIEQRLDAMLPLIVRHRTTDHSEEE